jgi:hypothetical protein
MTNKNNNIGDVHAPTKMSRKNFLRLSVGVAAAAGLGSLTGCSNNGRALRFNTLNDVRKELALIENNLDTLEMQQDWSLYKVLNHLAKTIEGAMFGFPEYDSAALQAVQYIAFTGFVAQGFMSHDLTAPVPGPDIADDGPLPEAFQRIRNAMDDLENFTGDLFPHFAYGPLVYDEWIWANTFHAADHFSSLTY